jgi:hypothetical protein
MQQTVSIYRDREAKCKKLWHENHLENEYGCLLLCCLLSASSGLTSEPSVSLYQTARRNNAEDSHFRIRRREDLKSNLKNELQNNIKIDF